MSTARTAGRPRQVSDDAISIATLEVLAECGATGLTLARVGSRVGVTAAAIRQRRGSKRELILAMARQRVGRTAARFEAARQGSPSPVAALEAAFVAELGAIERPEQLVNILSAYTGFPGDAEVGAAFAAEVEAMIQATDRLLAEAAGAGELAFEPAPGLGRHVVATAEGAMLLWALAPEGKLEDAVRAAIRRVLAPATAV